MGLGKPIHHWGGSTLVITGPALCWLVAVIAVVTAKATQTSQRNLPPQSLWITKPSRSISP
jgi:hypothetical protein